MRILWLSHVVPYPPKAGVLLRAYHLVRAVANTNDLDLVAFVQEPLLRTFYSNIDDGLEDCRKELAKFCRSVTFLPIEKLQRPYGKIRTAFTGLFTSDGYMGSWLDGPRARSVVAQRVKESGYDLAHLDCISLARFQPLLPTITATLGHHNAESHMLLRRSATETSRLRSWYFSQEAARLGRFEAQQSERFAAHITCSDLDNERLRPIMPRANFVTVPNGVDLNYFQPLGATVRPKSLIFVSSMNWYPNIDAALHLLRDIWPAIKGRVPEVTLDIIGANAPRAVIEAARSLQGVTLHGYVADIRPMMDSASLYICPIRDGGGTKLKVLDAFAMGKCVVAHPVACEGLAVTPGQDVVFATTPEDFASRVQELFENAELRTQIGAAARELAARLYSFDTIGRNLGQTFEDLVSSRRAQPP